ncbi:MAG: hypothetical protein JRL30_20625 [Deltaproteobacteria bacterium]|nr:hypothetical protein [Deltaproteobacteria bacterium]
MIPGLGKRKELDIEVISKPSDEYQTEAYLITGLPPAPAIMMDDELVVQGKDMTEEAIGAIISWKLGKASDG